MKRDLHAHEDARMSTLGDAPDTFTLLLLSSFYVFVDFTRIFSYSIIYIHSDGTIYKPKSHPACIHSQNDALISQTTCMSCMQLLQP